MKTILMAMVAAIGTQVPASHASVKRPDGMQITAGEIDATGGRVMNAAQVTDVGAAQGGGLPLLRDVRGLTLFSSSLPEVNLTVAKRFHYVGGRRFTLYGVADAEQHIFVDADERRNIRALYWIQFEHYLPGNNNRYDYRTQQARELGGLIFVYDTRLYTDYTGLHPDPSSDTASGRRLLAAAGYRLPPAAIRARLIHLPTPDHRAELIIVYVQQVDRARLPPGIANETPADDRFPRWSAVALNAAVEGLKIRK